MQLRSALVAVEIESPIRRGAHAIMVIGLLRLLFLSWRPDFLVGQSGSGLDDLKRVFARGDESVH